MSLTLHLDLATERQLKSVASQCGTTSRAFAVEALKDRLSHSVTTKSPKRQTTASLLAEINRGMSEDEWSYYAGLTRKRRRGKLTPSELQELRSISERLERLSARRLKLVAEVARRRRTSLEAELENLGIASRHV